MAFNETGDSTTSIPITDSTESSSSMLPSGAPTVGGKFMPATNPNSILENDSASADDKIAAMEEIRNQEAVAAQNKAAIELHKDAQDVQNYDAYQAEVEKYKNYNINAEAKGVKPLEMPDPNKFGIDANTIAKVSNAQTRQQVEPIIEQQKQQEQQVEEQKQNISQQIAAEKTALNQQNGYEAAIRDSREQMNKALEDINSHQEELSKVDPSRFWSNASTAQKIWAVVAMIVGGGPTSNKASGAEMIQGLIDRDVAAQKVDLDKALALKQNAVKRAQLEIEKFSALSKDAERKQRAEAEIGKLQQTYNDLGLQQANRLKVAKALTSGEGLSPEEAEVVVSDPEQRSRLVTLPNGRLKAASSKKSADEFTQWNSATVGAMKLTDQLKQQAADMGVTDKMTPAFMNAKKTAVIQTANALAGQLRLPFTGPGILNEKEYTRLMDDIIGDPTSLFKRQDVVMSQLTSLQKLLNNMQGAQLRAAGIPTTISPDQQKLENFIQSQLKAGADPVMVERAAVKLGLMH